MIDNPPIRKNFFSHNEVCTFADVKPYVFRFWEAEFDEISTELINGVKFYKDDTIEKVGEIKHLLFEEKLSIEQARLKLKRKFSSDKIATDLQIAKKLLEEVIVASNGIKERYNWF